MVYIYNSIQHNGMFHLRGTPYIFMLHSVITAFGSKVHAYEVLGKSILSVMMLLGKTEDCES
jgi:hypothetical protein